MSNPTRPFDFLYLETSVLRGASWPRQTADLINTVRLAKVLGIESVLPEAVESELELQYFREAVQLERKLSSAADSVRKHARDVTTIPAIDLGSGEADRRSEYRDRVKAIKDSLSLATAPFTKRSLGEFFELASRHSPPFGKEGQNFRDAVIFYSVIDHLQAQPRAAGLLVTGDGDLLNTDVEGVVARAGVSLRMAKSLHEVAAELGEHIGQARRAQAQTERSLLRGFLTSQIPAIETFLAGSLRLGPSDIGRFGQSLEEVTGMTVISVGEVRNPVDETPVPSERIAFSFDVNVEINAVVSDLGLDEAGKLAVGERRDRAQELMSAMRMGAVPELKTLTTPRVVEVDGEAVRRVGGYSDLSLKYCSLRPSFPILSHVLSLGDRYGG